MRALLPYAFTVLLLASTLPLVSPVAEASAVDVIGTLPVPALSNGIRNGVVGATAQFLDGKSYVFGGRMADGTVYEGVFIYDHASGDVRAGAQMPFATGTTERGRFSAASTVMGGKIYIFGGAIFVEVQLEPGSPATRVPKSIRDIIVYDPATGQFATLPTQLPDGLWGMSAVTAGKYSYLFGGFTFDITQPQNIARRNWIVRFDPGAALGAGQAQRMDVALPFAVQDGAAVVVQNRAYLMGGLADHENSTNRCPDNRYRNPDTNEFENRGPAPVCASDTILAFDTVTNIVEVVSAKLPYRGQFLQASLAKGKAYIAGARLQDGSASSSVVEFTPAAVSPIRVLTPTLPVGMFAMATTSDGTTITLFGGRMQNLADMTGNVTRIDPRKTAPWAPRSVIARASGTDVTISWEPPAYDGDTPVSRYRVYRTQEGGAEIYLGETNLLTYKDSGTPNVEYTYRITALNNCEQPVCEGPGARASTFASAVPPGPPARFSAYEGNSEVLLRWLPPSDDGGSNVTGYRIYRDEVPIPITTTLATSLQWRDLNVTNGNTYSYVVRAVNAKGEGFGTNAVRVTPKDVPPAPPSISATQEGDGVTVTWEAPAATVKEFVLLRGLDPTNLISVANVASTTTMFSDTTVEKGRTWYYAVASTNDVGQSPPSEIASVSLVSKPSQPRSVFAAPLEGGVRVTWMGPDDPGTLDSALLKYYVKRDGRIVATDLRATAWTDTPLAAGISHTYTVTAFNGIESDPSEAVRAAAKPVENKAPVAKVAVLTSVVLAQDDVQLDGSQSTDADGIVAEYVWDFGDGSAIERSISSSITHRYVANGTYTVKLVVKDNRGGQSEESSALVIVGEVPNIKKVEDDGIVPPTGPTVQAPGTGETKPLPTPGLLALLLLAAVVAAVTRVHRRR